MNSGHGTVAGDIEPRNGLQIRELQACWHNQPCVWEEEGHLLELGVGGHAALGVALCQLKHAVVEAVEARQRHKLERIPQRTQLLHQHQETSLQQLRML